MLRTEVLASIREKGGNVDEKTFEKRIMNPSGVWCPDEGGVNVRSFVYSSLSSTGIPSEIFQYLWEPMTHSDLVETICSFKGQSIAIAMATSFLYPRHKGTRNDVPSVEYIEDAAVESDYKEPQEQTTILYPSAYLKLNEERALNGPTRNLRYAEKRAAFGDSERMTPVHEKLLRRTVGSVVETTLNSTNQVESVLGRNTSWRSYVERLNKRKTVGGKRRREEGSIRKQKYSEAKYSGPKWMGLRDRGFDRSDRLIARTG
ncbi:hypothetical protein V1477_005255 [Vespula maculifrons]|uniref:Uncharacterized protein n=1 Tax=Vespula maculifrons TaxID=7453 RepID=A0ABD2CP52_VESMC